MATGYGTPVRFTKEKNVWDLFGVFNIGSGGAINVATVNTSGGPQYINKGIANVWQNTPTFTGATSSGSATITSVSSFFGIFSGMAITGAGSVAVVGTITTSTGSIVMSSPALTPSASGTFVASGGQYIFQFGVQNNVGSLTQSARLDTYNRLLDFNASYDASTGSSIGTATQQALAPSASQYFVIQNNINVKTIPFTATSASTDASLIVQFGNAAGATGSSFVPSVPQSGTAVRFNFTFGNTTAP